MATQNHSALVKDPTTVPFLPVNPSFSSTRNQVSRGLLIFVTLILKPSWPYSNKILMIVSEYSVITEIEPLKCLDLWLEASVTTYSSSINNNNYYWFMVRIKIWMQAGDCKAREKRSMLNNLTTNFPNASITSRAQANHEPYYLFIKFQFLRTQWKLTDMHFNGFISSSVCVHTIREHADDVSKFLGWNCMTLLALLCIRILK